MMGEGVIRKLILSGGFRQHLPLLGHGRRYPSSTSQMQNHGSANRLDEFQDDDQSPSRALAAAFEVHLAK